MITEFRINKVPEYVDFTDFYAENFPIELRSGDEIFIDDFLHLLKKGSYYFDDETSAELLPEGFEPIIKVVGDASYGFKNGKVVRLLDVEII
jgi:hypothetical protein